MTRTTLDEALPPRPGPNAYRQLTSNEQIASRAIYDSIELQKQQMREVRSHTARIRQALRDLPTDLAAEGWDSTNPEKHRLREDLQEIIGSATHIADLLGVEL